MRRALAPAIVALLLTLLLAGGGYAWLASANRATSNAEVQVEAGDTPARIGQKLERRGVIASARVFRWQARLFGGGTIKPGDYAIARGMSGRAILARLISGRTIVRLVTIYPGMPSVLVQERLMQTPLLQGSLAVPSEGAVLPDSYAYQRGEPRAAVMARMEAAMRKALAVAWKERSPRAVVKTPYEAVILASIVDKETGKASERAMIAGVYSNRLRIGMRLQADPTVIYPYTQGRALGGPILKSQLQARNPFNTYVNAGLPPQPIANPGLDAIHAVLHPADTRALYFVADGSGGHVFAETLDDHNANVARWRAARMAP